jgi:hypothetical protein
MTTRSACGGGCGALSRRFRYEQTTHRLVALAIAQLYCCAEAFGYAAHKVVGAPLVAGDAVEGDPCPPSA